MRSTRNATLLGLEHTVRKGSFILAANHTCPYDIALLIHHVRRRIDFVSITEVFKIPWLGRFYGAMNAFPLDRSKADPATVRIIMDRLNRGRAVAMFPEGGFRLGDQSVLHGGSLRSGIGRIARMTQAPIIPCAIEDSMIYNKRASWLPLRRSRYGLAFGPPLPPPDQDATHQDTKAFELELTDRIRHLHAELLRAMDRTPRQAATRRYKTWNDKAPTPL